MEYRQRYVRSAIERFCEPNTELRGEFAAKDKAEEGTIGRFIVEAVILLSA
jgi:hypothetical protein